MATSSAATTGSAASVSSTAGAANMQDAAAANPIDWARFVEQIHAHQRILLTSHIRPDCDALGSELGMAGILEAIGKEVWIVNGQATPPNLQFIDPDRKIRTIGQDVSFDQLEKIELILVLDTSAWAQLGPMSEVLKASKAKKIVLDHHMSSDDLGAEMFKNVKAEAAGRLVVEAAQQLGVPLTPSIATPLFAALATDTGWFRFGSAAGGTYRCAADLVDAGARPAAIYNALNEQDTLPRLKLVGRTLANAETELHGRLIHTAITQTDFKDTGALPSDTEDVINLTLTVGGTQVAVIFVEQPTGGFKISFRSRCHVDCSKLAERFGGGGHKAAAGAFVSGNLHDARGEVLDAVREAMG